MDDLSSTISSFLSDPGAMEQLRSMAEALGLDTQSSPTPSQPSAQEPELQDFFSPAQLTALLGAMNQASAPNETTSLLHALRPLLGEERQPKLDRAIRAMQLMNAARTVSKALEK